MCYADLVVDLDLISHGIDCPKPFYFNMVTLHVRVKFLHTRGQSNDGFPIAPQFPSVVFDVAMHVLFPDRTEGTACVERS